MAQKMQVRRQVSHERQSSPSKVDHGWECQSAGTVVDSVRVQLKQLQGGASVAWDATSVGAAYLRHPGLHRFALDLKETWRREITNFWAGAVGLQAGICIVSESLCVSAKPGGVGGCNRNEGASPPQAPKG